MRAGGKEPKMPLALEIKEALIYAFRAWLYCKSARKEQDIFPVNSRVGLSVPKRYRLFRPMTSPTMQKVYGWVVHILKVSTP